MKLIMHSLPAIIFAITITSYSQSPEYSQCKRNLNIAILNNATTKDSILVTLPFNSVVVDVNVTIDTIIHTWVSDLSIYLRKSNTGVKIFNRTGGSGDNFIRTILNDSAGILIDNAVAPFTGSFRPHNPLSIFNELYDASGYWVLAITDTASGDFGYLRSWCISICYYVYMGGIYTVEIPNTYRIYQNYPNPFNPVTKIKYGLPKSGYVKLTVYDELGKQVEILQEGYQQANTYEAVFDATNLPSGVYYYKLEADGFSDSKKMVILK